MRRNKYPLWNINKAIFIHVTDMKVFVTPVKFTHVTNTNVSFTPITLIFVKNSYLSKIAKLTVRIRIHVIYSWEFLWQIRNVKYKVYIWLNLLKGEKNVLHLWYVLWWRARSIMKRGIDGCENCARKWRMRMASQMHNNSLNLGLNKP